MPSGYKAHVLQRVPCNRFVFLFWRSGYKQLTAASRNGRGATSEGCNAGRRMKPVPVTPAEAAVAKIAIFVSVKNRTAQ